MRTYRTKEKKYTCNEIRFLNVAIAPAESSVASLCVDVETDKNGNEIRHIGSDVGLILKQHKLSKLNTFTIDTMVQNLKRDVPSLSHYDDETIAKSIKSRYVQSSADIFNYERQLKNELHDVLKDIEFEKTKKEILEKYEKNSKTD